MQRKIKMEIEDGQGGKFTFAFNGPLNNSQLSKLNQLIDLTNQNSSNSEIEIPEGNTLFGKICGLVETDFPLGSFTSQDMSECYKTEFNDELKLSTISTYLTRLYERGNLTRERTRAGWSYRKTKPIDIITHQGENTI